jgi:hypothetical protein
MLQTEIVEHIDDLPKSSVFFNQVTSPQSVRFIIVVVLLIVLMLSLVVGFEFSKLLETLLVLVIGSYFEPSGFSSSKGDK